MLVFMAGIYSIANREDHGQTASPRISLVWIFLFVQQLVLEMSEHLLLVERQRFRNVSLNFRALNISTYA